MELVIKISEEDYKTIKSNYENGFSYKFFEIIVNGTPLPKGHGRLIDYGCVVDAIDDWINTEEYRYTNATDYLRNRIKNAPTIIEGR